MEEEVRAAVFWPFSLGYRMLWGNGEEGSRRPPQEMAERPMTPSQIPLRPATGVTDPDLLATLKSSNSSIEDLSFPGSAGEAPLIPHNHFSHQQNLQTQQHYSILSVPIPIEEERFQAYLASLPEAAFPRYKLVLPKKSKTLVLDLDETLVHSTSASAEEYDFMVEVLVERSSCLYYVHKRPHVDHFLEVVSNWFDLAIYTASLREYADPVVNLLDRGRKLFSRRLFRNACIEQEGGLYLKDLSKVDADLSRVFLLDNSVVSFARNPDSAIFIDSWVGERTDNALLDLLPFLDALRFVEDVRSILSLRAFG
jgi:CTD nuclear envelope phosphatase 1